MQAAVTKATTLRVRANGQALEKEQETVWSLCAGELAVFKEQDPQWYQNDPQYQVLPPSLSPFLRPSLCPSSLHACTVNAEAVNAEAACKMHVGAWGVGRTSEGDRGLTKAEGDQLDPQETLVSDRALL
jgi:hypothetical protein